MAIRTFRHHNAVNGQTRLVRAHTKPEVFAFCSPEQITVEPVSAEEMYELGKQGVEIEEAVKQRTASE